MTEEQKLKLQAGRKKHHEDRIITISPFAGYIEDVYGTGTSYNVFRLLDKAGKHKFYKSAYTLKDATTKLKEI